MTHWFWWCDISMGKGQPRGGDLANEYKAALRRYVSRGGEAALERAYELGRRGLGEGAGVLRMVALHHRSMIEVMANRKVRKTLSRDALMRAGVFFAESMSSFEMTHRAFAEANAALRQMNQTLEGEIKRIAHALHHEAGQLLAAVHLSLNQVERELNPAAQRSLQGVKDLLEEVGQHMRRLSHELRPTILDDLGLVPALEFLSEGVAKRSGLRIAVRSPKTKRLPAFLETVLYRVVQEALNNIIRHARAKSVSIRLRSSGTAFHCSIVDDGVGFDARGVRAHSAERGLGLLGMREKLQPLGGAVKITSAPGQGTKLFITVPREVNYADSSPRR